MERYIEFRTNNGAEYIKVSDFNKETIQSLPQYQKKWTAFFCWEGTPRYFDGKILDIFPGEVKLSVYYGKRISFANVFEMVGNDLKYKNLLENMKSITIMAFSNESSNNQEMDYEEYHQKYVEFSKHYNATHSCLFTMPDNFNVENLNRENSMTVEEFDSNIVLNYEDTFKNITLNAKYGTEYYEEHKQLLSIFHEYFTMLCSVSNQFKGEDYEALFSIISFNFYGFSMFTSFEDINLFLEVYEYVYSNIISKDKYSFYKEYVKKTYSEDLSRE